MTDLKNVKSLISGIRSINKAQYHEVEIGEDEEPCYWQRKEWVEWILEEADKAEQDYLAYQKKPLEVELGHGDKLVTDIYDDKCGDWAGIAISNGECPIGEIIDTGADRVAELEPLLTIISANPASMDVIIAACQRAKEKLINTPMEAI